MERNYTGNHMYSQPFIHEEEEPYSCFVSAAEEQMCLELFQELDVAGTGQLVPKELKDVIERAFRSCELRVQGRLSVREVVALMMMGSSSSVTLLTYPRFVTLYQRWVQERSTNPNPNEHHPRHGGPHHRHSMTLCVWGGRAELQAAASPSLPKNANIGLLRRLDIWVTNHKVRLIWISLYVVLNVACWSWKYHQYCSVGRNPVNFAVSGTGICIARGFAQVCLLNAGFILLPLCHRLMSRLRNIQGLHPYVPFDDAIAFHKITGYMLLVSGLAHTVGQVYAYVTSIRHAPEALWPHSALARVFPSPPSWWAMFGSSLPGWTGVLLVLISVVVTPFTFHCVRQSNFNWFWYSHMLYYPVFLGLLYVHGLQSWLEPSQGWKILTLPTLVFIVDRWKKIKLYANALNVSIDPSSVVYQDDSGACLAVGLKMAKPEHFRNLTTHRLLPGMYVMLNIPKLSAFEWHPFTLTSAPDDRLLSLHIRSRGDWTTALIELIRLAKAEEEFPSIVARVDGPIGAPTMGYLRYRVVLMIGSGIGVTPFASILRDLACRFASKRKEGADLDKLYFHWTTRHQSSLQWFSTCMNTVTRFDREGKIEIHNHLTTTAPTRSAAVVKFVQTLVHRMNGEDVISGLQTHTRTHFGRPNWHHVFSDILARHPRTHIGVFFCGAKSFQRELGKLCATYSANDCGSRFELHAENF